MNWNASDKLSFDVHSAFDRDFIDALQSGNNWATLTGNAENGDPRQATALRPYGEAWISVADIKKITTTSDANRWTGSTTANYALTSAFSNRLTVGADVVDEQKQRFFPQDGNYGSAYVTNGEKTNATRNYSVYTLDYLGTVNFHLPMGIGSTFSFGGQGFYETEVLTAAIGKQFAGPGISTVSAASQTFGAEQYNHAVQIGGLAQNRFSFGDRLFTTVGVRVDGNSAFGSGFGYQTYPKIDAAYNLDSYSWMPKAVSSLKLRAALGTAGKAPGPFDSFQTYQPVAVYTNTPALIPQGPGNVKLGPEKSTEVDAGFDAGFFGDRVGIEASVFKTQVNNAIVPVLLPPSQGFSQTQSQNIGGIVNHGWEASISLLTFERSSFSWRNEFRFDGLTNKVTSLGGNNGVTDAFGNPIRVGYPVGALFGIKPVSYAAPTASAPSGTWTGTDTAVYFGPPLPTFNMSYAPTLKWRRISFYTLLTMERGAWFNNGDYPYRFRQHTGDDFLKLLGPGRRQHVRVRFGGQLLAHLRRVRQARQRAAAHDLARVRRARPLRAGGSVRPHHHAALRRERDVVGPLPLQRSQLQLGRRRLLRQQRRVPHRSVASAVPPVDTIALLIAATTSFPARYHHMRHMKKSQAVRCAWAGAALLAAAGCHDLLSVQNPQAFTDAAANSATLLPAVAAGAEGAMQLSISSLATMTGMLSDEFWHTGTWSDWLDVSKGLVRKNWPFDGAFSGPENALLQARGTAEAASRRFENVFKDTAKVSPLFITSEMARAWSDLELAMSMCQAPSTAGAPMVSDTVLFKQAADTFTALLPLIRAAHFTSTADQTARINQALAGLARADLMLGAYDAAMTNALLVPAGFRYDAVYSNNSDFQNNQMANQGNANYNRSFSIRASIWQSLIDTVDFTLLDPYSGKPDQRVLLGHDNNNSKRLRPRFGWRYALLQHQQVSVVRVADRTHQVRGDEPHRRRSEMAQGRQPGRRERDEHQPRAARRLAAGSHGAHHRRCPDAGARHDPPGALCRAVR